MPTSSSSTPAPSASKSEEKLFSYLGRLSSSRRSGPSSSASPAASPRSAGVALLRERPFVDFVVGPDNYRDLASIALQAASGPCLATGRSRVWREFGPGQTLRGERLPAPTSRSWRAATTSAPTASFRSAGAARSSGRSQTSSGEVGELAAGGAKEVQFLGQNVNSYRDPETGRGLDALLDLAGAVPGPAWLRFITSHPAKFGPGLIAAMARNPKVCRSLHLPLQSGSTAVLRRMNRGYGREDYLDLVSRLREALPGLLLTTDIIVGFPGETEDDFEATLDALRRVRFAGIFSFRYSPRPLTAAARLADDVPLEVKRRRLLELQALQKTIQADLLRSFVGRKLDVLVTGPSPKGGGRFAGRSEGNLVVNFAAPRVTIGAFATVLITGSGPYSLHGELAG